MKETRSVSRQRLSIRDPVNLHLTGIEPKAVPADIRISVLIRVLLRSVVQEFFQLNAFPIEEYLVYAVLCLGCVYEHEMLRTCLVSEERDDGRRVRIDLFDQRVASRTEFRITAAGRIEVRFFMPQPHHRLAPVIVELALATQEAVVLLRKIAVFIHGRSMVVRAGQTVVKTEPYDAPGAACGSGGDLPEELIFRRDTEHMVCTRKLRILSLLSAVAAAESASISDNLKWGIRKRFQDGTYKISCAPYGYRTKNGKLSVEPGEAETVRKIYSAFLSGKSLSAICRDLDEESIPPRKGGKWSVRTVQDILLNLAYVGTAVFQKGFTDDSFHWHKNQGQLPQYEILNHHEPIVSPEIFQAASALISSLESSVQPGTFQRRYAFSGRIICGKCGSMLKRQKRPETVSWACRGHLDHCRCSLMPIPDDLLKVAFCTMWNRLRFGAAKVLRPYVDAAEGSGQFKAADALYRAVKGSPPLMAFSDELFLDHVSRILIVSQNIAIFEMKCGLRFRELIPYRQPRNKVTTAQQTTASQQN